MESLGKKLSETRLSRGLDLEQVARETNISSRYLEALESEDFSVFPGEPYLLGFLRNYCEYLGLNSSEFITAYKNIKIQETPVPLKELMPKRTIADTLMSTRSSTRLALIAIPLALILLGFAGAGMYLLLSGKDEVAPAEIITRTPAAYEISEGDLKERFYVGDTLTVKTATEAWKLAVEATAPSVKFSTPTGTCIVELGQDMMIDLSGDDVPDIAVFVADLFRNDPSRGADIQFSMDFTVRDIAAEEQATAAANADVVLATESSQPSAAADAQKQQVLFESGSAYPVTLNATFRGYCLFRYESDRTTREERYYQKSELLTVQAKNGLRIWASNGNSVKMQIVAGGKTVDLELSRPGEVIVRDLKWLKDDESGRYKFVVMNID
ncbi:MAG TPA: helix-turn-helix domain-containing protein [Treponemataceae bacterium]|jgi:cytoskeletal protein RodZ|nr:MAG: Helix-turn-helix domain protein [Spirochaetes bacterium ADurb.Bin269]TAH54449.1 MAG: helix-turn-helix domain-containing protein [Treponema sp.]HOC29955.1 helix-turn-helix domain-containing protein [Treponemataceae bacterium]HPX47042.1 helix-turn-helix domain-containing protein [Treponemataceae bacterium]HQL33622.1 helix-turn-helix domain-containing protein [Treponemataceae bacterium]